MESFLIFYFAVQIIAGLIVFIFTIFNGSYIPDYIEILINLSYYCLGSMIMGFIFIGTSYFIVGSLIEKVLGYFNKRKYEDVLLVICLSILGTCLFFFTAIGDLFLAHIDGVDYNYTKLIYKILGAYTIPAYLLFQLIKDYIRHNKYYNY